MNLQVFVACFVFACVTAQPDLSVDLQSGSVSSLPSGISWRYSLTSSSVTCGRRGVLKATFNTSNRKRLEINLEYGSSGSSGWTFNAGDSATNNGWGGDGATQSNDAEVQIKEGVLAMYTRDHPTTYWALLRSESGFVTSGSRVIINVSDGKVTADNGSQSVIVQSFRLFALRGQSDATGPVNYDVYIGLNRVVSGSRSGSGLCKAFFTWHDDA